MTYAHGHTTLFLIQTHKTLSCYTQLMPKIQHKGKQVLYFPATRSRGLSMLTLLLGGICTQWNSALNQLQQKFGMVPGKKCHLVICLLLQFNLLPTHCIGRKICIMGLISARYHNM